MWLLGPFKNKPPWRRASSAAREPALYTLCSGSEISLLAVWRATCLGKKSECRFCVGFYLASRMASHTLLNSAAASWLNMLKHALFPNGLLK